MLEKTLLGKLLKIDICDLDKNIIINDQDPGLDDRAVGMRGYPCT